MRLALFTVLVMLVGSLLVMRLFEIGERAGYSTKIGSLAEFADIAFP